MMKKTPSTGILLPLLLVTGSLVTFGVQVRLGLPDIPDHNQFVMSWLAGDPSVKLYSLYYLLLLIPAVVFRTIAAVHVVSVILLAAAVWVKYEMSKRQLLRVAGVAPAAGSRWHRYLTPAVIAFSLAVAQNLIYKPSATMSLGYLPVNTWHNSTTIFLMPFALLLFFRSARTFRDPLQPGHVQFLGSLVLLAILTIFIKPSYFFVFAVAFPVTSLIRFGPGKAFFTGAAVSAVSCAALVVIYRYLFVNTEATVVVAPFRIWSFWTRNIPLSLISSLLFPLLFLVLFPRAVRTNPLLQYAWIGMCVSLAVYILLAETGDREIHANFSWQNIVCNYLLFLCTWMAFLPGLLAARVWNWRQKLVLACYAGHVITGLVFLVKLPFFGAR